MQVLLEDFVPIDRSVRWAIQDAYFAAEGISPWKNGDLPSDSTNNYPIMRQHARLLLEVVDDLLRAGRLRPDEPVYVLELGGGLGKSAFYFHHALRTGCGKAGKALASRLRYVFSDYSRSALRQAMEEFPLQRLLESGNLIPAFLDLRRPSELQSLDGSPLRAEFAAVLANYVCDCTPTKVLRKKQDRFFEMEVQTWAETETERPGAEVLRECLAHPGKRGLLRGLWCPEEWRQVRLDDALPSKLHEQAVRAVTADYPVATFAYPFVFLEALHQLQGLSIPGALFLVNDFGTCLKSRLVIERDRVPRMYGNALAYRVNFAILEAFALAAGWDAARTDNPSLSVHTAGIRTMPKAPPAYHRVFRKIYDRDPKGHEFSDFRDSALSAQKYGDHDRAIRFLERCLRLSPADLEILYHLSRACRDAGLFEKAMAYAKKGYGLVGYGTYDFEDEVARAYEQMGRSDEALQWSQRSLAIREKALGPQHPSVASSLNNLATLYQDQGRYVEAEPLFKRALATWEKALGPDHPDVAASLNKVAAFYLAQGRYAEAESHKKRALEILEAALGREHLGVAGSLDGLARIYHFQGRYPEAEQLYKRSLAIRENVQGPEHPRVAQNLNNLALLYLAQGRHPEAQPLFLRALATFERTLGPEHPNVASTLNNLAGLYTSQRRFAEAEPLYQRTLAIRETAFGPNHPYVGETLGNYVALLRGTGRAAEAAKLDARAKAIRAKHVQVKISLGQGKTSSTVPSTNLSRADFMIVSMI